MGLLNVLRTGVQIADKQTKSLQESVRFERCTGKDIYGKPTYAAAVTLKAIVERKNRQMQTPAGQIVAARTSVLFLDASTLTTATSGNGVKQADRITLLDGTTGPILDFGGFDDANLGRPLVTEVFLG